MKNIFKGPRTFWLVLFISSSIIFSLGLKHLHVSYFNLFIIIVFIVSALLLFFILKSKNKTKIYDK